jgi:hypothetical protein
MVRHSSRKCCGGWYSHFGEVEKKTAGQPQTIVDVERLIEMRIVNQALPANGCTGFLEIDPHDNPKVRGQFVDCGLPELPHTRAPLRCRESSKDPQ